MRRTMLLTVLVLLSAAAVRAADDNGFTTLFDSQSLKGWTVVGGQPGNWLVQDGLIVTKGAGGGWLSTDGTYADFDLKLEYRLRPGGNSGVFIRSPRSGDPAYSGMEIQILDDDAPVYKNLQPGQYCGSVYRVIACERGHTKPAGEWNAMEIIAKGPHITVKLNGATITDGNLKDHEDAVSEHPGIKRTEGYIGLQSHSETVEFRNIGVKELH